jgi:hypothetical protein
VASGFGFPDAGPLPSNFTLAAAAGIVNACGSGFGPDPGADCSGVVPDVRYNAFLNVLDVPDGDLTVTTTPLPAALPLFASGLGALGLLGWLRRRRAAVVG